MFVVTAIFAQVFLLELTIKKTKKLKLSKRKHTHSSSNKNKKAKKDDF